MNWTYLYGNCAIWETNEIINARDLWIYLTFSVSDPIYFPTSVKNVLTIEPTRLPPQKVQLSKISPIFLSASYRLTPKKTPLEWLARQYCFCWRPFCVSKRKIFIERVVHEIFFSFPFVSFLNLPVWKIYGMNGTETVENKFSSLQRGSESFAKFYFIKYISQL